MHDSYFIYTNLNLWLAIAIWLFFKKIIVKTIYYLVIVRTSLKMFLRATSCNLTAVKMVFLLTTGKAIGIYLAFQV